MARSLLKTVAVALAAGFLCGPPPAVGLSLEGKLVGTPQIPGQFLSLYPLPPIIKNNQELRLSPSTRILLDGGAQTAFVEADGSFVLDEVSDGPHLLQVVSNEYIFVKARVAVAGSEMLATIHVDGTNWNAGGPELKSPLEISVIAIQDPFTPRPKLTLYGLIMANPMLLMMGGMFAMFFFLPKVMENMDPEDLKQMQAARADMAGGGASGKLEMPDDNLAPPGAPPQSFSRKSSTAESSAKASPNILSPQANSVRRFSYVADDDSSRSSHARDVRSQKEKELAKELRSLLKQDAWNKIPDLLAEWELLSPRDVLAECGIQLMAKDKQACERTLDYVSKRGPMKSNEYSYASAIVHFATSQYYMNKVTDCVNNLARALKFIDQQLRNLDSDTTSSKSSGQAPHTTAEEWAEIKDWTTVFLAVMAYRQGNFKETVRLLECLANYKLVLIPGRCAFVTLLKAKSLCVLGEPEQALRSLAMRQSQEDALIQIDQLSVAQISSHTRDSHSRKPSTYEADSHESSTERQNVSDGPASLIACHDLHILVLDRIGEDKEAKEIFASVKDDGSKRPAHYKDFVRKAHCEDVGNSLIDSWSPRPTELSRRF
ncbi:hypothetical protein HDU83_007470 [Entophlyctis luteolus]|nr:hypothetical protein HDU83_007470 [Entophlyctis luteolus]